MFKRRLPLFLIIIFVFGFLLLMGIKKYVPERNIEWNIYKNMQLGYEVSYPTNWYVKEKYPSNHKQTNTNNIQWSNFVSLGDVYIDNIKEEVVAYGAGLKKETKKGSSFIVLVYEVTPDISSIEDWILLEKKYTYYRYIDKTKIFTPLEIARGDKIEHERDLKIWSKRVDERVQKNLDAVMEKKIGDIKIKAWEGYGWNYDPDSEFILDLIYGIDFIHKGKFYRIRYTSGSQEQFKKDLGTFKRMLVSFELK